MQIEKLRGNTYWIPSYTNIGVYTYKNKNCLLIETGINRAEGNKIDDILQQKGYHPKYIINTHAHVDHWGGNKYFQEHYSGCEVCTSHLTGLYMQMPAHFAATVFSASPIKKMVTSYHTCKPDRILEIGSEKIQNSKFEIIPLDGHISGQIGIITPDQVCFLGDGIFSTDTMEKYGLPYLYDIELSIKTLEYIKQIEAEVFVLAHAKRVYSKEEIMTLVEKNLINIYKYTKQVKELLMQPMTREELVANLIILNDLPMKFTQYYLYSAIVSAFIQYLYERKEIKEMLEDGKLYYFGI